MIGSSEPMKQALKESSFFTKPTRPQAGSSTKLIKNDYFFSAVPYEH